MILINIISEQTIPNVLFIKEMMHPSARYLFITSSKMELEGKTDAIIRACNLHKERCEGIIVNPDDLTDIKGKINQRLSAPTSRDEQFLVNITGGTKLTSMLVFNLFLNFNSQFYYIPFGSGSILEIKKDFSTNTHLIKTRLTLDQYLRACNLYFSSDTEKPVFSKASAEQIFSSFRNVEFELQSFPYDLALKSASSEIGKDNICGSWFENYMFYQLISKLSLNEKQLARSVLLYQTLHQPTHDQEIDFLFVLNNELYMVECKVSIGKSSSAAIADLSKMAYLSRRFGLSSKAFFLTLSLLRKNKDNKFYETFQNKLKLLGTTNLADRTDFIKNEFDLQNFFKTKISL